MAEYILLDSSPLGLACGNPRYSKTTQCLDWLDGLLARSVVVVVPEVADYEVRRELIRIRALSSLARLDALVSNLGLKYAPITTPQVRQAAEFWALARQQGLPTAHPQALDGDVILAASAVMIAGPKDQVIVATENIGHLARFCDARLWSSIA